MLQGSTMMDHIKIGLMLEVLMVTRSKIGTGAADRKAGTKRRTDLIAETQLRPTQLANHFAAHSEFKVTINSCLS